MSDEERDDESRPALHWIAPEHTSASSPTLPFAKPEDDVHQAKTHLSRLLAQVEAGEEVVVARRGKPVARLVAFESRGERRPDVFKGRVVIPDSFLDPLPEEELKSWEGE